MVKSIAKFFLKESEVANSHKIRIRIDRIRERLSDISKLVQIKKERIEYSQERLDFDNSERYKKWVMQAPPEAVWKYKREREEDSAEILRNLKDIAKLNDEKESLLKELDVLNIQLKDELNKPTNFDDWDF